MKHHPFDRDFNEILFAQLISVFGGLAAGFFIASYRDMLFLIPGMLILLPGFLELRGNISGSLASRLSSGLFIKAIDKKKINQPIVRSNIIASFLLAFIVCLGLGIISFLVTYFFFNVRHFSLIFAPVLAGILANIVEIPLTIGITFYLFRRGHDPNNFIGPIITSTGDVVSVVALLVVFALI